MAQTRTPIKVIIDTDLTLGGFGKDIDDSLAVVMALNSPELDVIAISGVYGNTKLREVSKNIPILLEMFPEKEALPEYIEGAAGYKDWAQKSKLPGITRLAEKIKANAPITLVPIGPLTNIALLFHFHPEVIDSIQELVIMGGALRGWEFNFANDPPATEFVLKLPIPTTICGYEVTLAQKFTKGHYQEFVAKQTPRTIFLENIVKKWLKTTSLATKKGKEKGFPPHDPTAIAYLIKPKLFESELFPVGHNHLGKKKHKRFDFSSKTTVNDDLKAKQSELSEEELKIWVNWTLKIKSAEFMELLMERLY